MALGIRNVCVALCFGLAMSAPVISAEEPEIQIRYGEDRTIHEYRVKGELVEIKIIPKVGPAYYLVQTENGDFERSETSRIVFPSWKLIEW